MCSKIGSPRRVVLADIRAPDGEQLDKGMVVWFPAPESYTGEDSAELHLHGSRAILADVFSSLSAIEGLRLAEAGEFTMRAFQNGKVDLTGAEALADLIEAETSEQRRFAAFNAGRAHDELYERWRSVIIATLAEMTAMIDFADEADVEDRADVRNTKVLQSLIDEIDSHMERYKAGKIIRDGFKVAIVGEPNVGKSSLLNALAGRDVAIVTNVPGTTRDVLEVALDLNGRKVIVYDTAGIRQSNDPVEEIGIDRARQTAEHADLVLWLCDVRQPESAVRMPDMETPVLRVGNKQDLIEGQPVEDMNVLVSAKTHCGLDRLVDVLANAAEDAGGLPDVVPFRQRHVDLLKNARQALVDACLADGLPVEFRAEALRLAAESLGRISGRVDVEDLLDVVFSRFCIGK